MNELNNTVKLKDKNDLNAIEKIIEKWGGENGEIIVK